MRILAAAGNETISDILESVPYGLRVHKSTVRTRINDPCARALELPLLGGSDTFFFFL